MSLVLLTLSLLLLSISFSNGCSVAEAPSITLRLLLAGWHMYLYVRFGEVMLIPKETTKLMLLNQQANTKVHGCKCMIGNQGRMVGNSKICMEIQS